MPNFFKSLLLAALIALLIVSFFFLEEKDNNDFFGPQKEEKAEIALIFESLGSSRQDFHRIYDLKLPLTVSVIPGLRFSQNVAHIAARAGFSVLINLPLEPKEKEEHPSLKFDYIGSYLAKNQINRLLNNNLNSLRIAIGVSTYQGSQATQEREFLNHILDRIKQRNLIFIDSRTTPDSIAYEVAEEKNIKTAYSHAFLSPEAGPKKLKEKIETLIADNPGQKIILIARPEKNTFEFFENNLSWLRQKARFITIEEYFR